MGRRSPRSPAPGDELMTTTPHFDDQGVTVGDAARLKAHLQRVFDLLLDGRPRTLQQIASAVGCSESGAGARIRDLRKPRNGSFSVIRERLGGEDARYAYRLDIPAIGGKA